jgi:hypothetical protein
MTLREPILHSSPDELMEQNVRVNVTHPTSLQRKAFFREPYSFFFGVNLAFGLRLGDQVK